MKNILLLHFFLLTAESLPAQQKEFILKNFTQEEGLPSNETYCVFEDSKKYLWIGTDNGVARYDGNKFEQFNLPDNVIFQIREDSKGRIWFFSHTGKLAYFENQKMYPFKYNNAFIKRIKNLHIKDAFIDTAGNISMNSSIDSSYEIKATGFIKSIANHNIPSQSFFKIDVKKNKKCFTQLTKNWIGGADTIFISVNEGNKNMQYVIPIKHISSTHYGSILTEKGDIYFFCGYLLTKLSTNGHYDILKMPNPVICMKQYENTLWVGMLKGGIQLLTENLIAKQKNLILEGTSVSGIENDYENGIWLSTIEKGIYYIKKQEIKQLVFTDGQPPRVSRVYNYYDSFLLYANRKGIYKWENEKSSTLLPLENTNISGMIVSKNKTLICMGGFDFFSQSFHGAGSGFKNFVCYNGQAKETVLVGDSFLCSSATMYVWGETSDFFRSANPLYPYGKSVRESKRLSQKAVTLFADAKNNLWGGGNDGLYVSPPPFDTLSKVKIINPILSKGITHIAQLANGMLCTGLRFGGVALLEDSNLIANITEKNGLLNDKVNFLLAVKNQLWVATVKGISVINFTSFKPIKYSINNIGKKDGFYNVIINQLTQYKNNIIAATNNGMYIFENPDSILTSDLPDIPFYINTISSYKGDTVNIENITLPYSKSRLAIKFNAISYNSYENIKYLYRFDQGDTIWQSTTNSELILENTQPGSYILFIKAVIENQDRKSETIEFKFIIEKPWWQNNWFRFFGLLLVSCLVYLFVKRRIKKIKTEEKRKTDLNAKLAELEQTALRSQMNPHFIFNCLTSIQQLIISGNKTDANEYLVKFSRLIRKTLEMSARPFISIREEKEYLEEYLFLEQLRLLNQFDYSIVADVSINTDNTFIPNMMIQPVVENCVRHGIKSLQDKKGIINIVFKAGQNSISCTVTDNGVGRNSISSFSEVTFTEHKSYGMDIVRKRLETFSEFNINESGIEIKDLLNADGSVAGTEVILHLPYKNNV